MSMTKSSTEDPLMRVIGSIGVYQLLLFTYTSLAIIVHAWQMMANKFLLYPVDFWCARPPHLTNIDAALWKNLTSWREDDGTLDACRILDLDLENIEDLQQLQSEVDEWQGEARDCTAFEFDQSHFQETATARWSLVCGWSPLRRVSQLLFFTGTFFGVFGGGLLADKYGRMLAFRFWLLVWIVSGLLASFVSDFWLWSMLRFVAGGASIAYNTCQTVYTMEWASLKWRSVTNNIFRALPFGLGVVSLGGLVVLETNMVRVEQVIALSGLPLLLGLFLTPESPRWLLVNGQTDKGVEVALKACKFNRREVDDSRLQDLRNWSESESRGDHNVESGQLFRLLLKYPCSRRNLLVISLGWMALSMAYFGLAYNTPSFNWHPVVVFVVPNALLLPLAFLVPYMENTFGRKPMLTFNLLACGVCLMLTLLINQRSGHFGSVIVLSWIGYAFSGFSFDIAYSYTKELFPTPLRTTCLSFGSAAARVGSMLSPLVAYADTVDVTLPVVIYGGVSIAAGLMSILIWPETFRQKKMPDSLDECETLASGPNAWIDFISGRKKTRRIQPRDNEMTMGSHPN